MDHSELGVKIGLEIHQQIGSPRKLFCNCPAEIRDGQPDFKVERYLRASAGETGKIDAAAKYENVKKKKYVYHGYKENVCAVELDEEPIGNANEEAVNVCLQMAESFKSKISDAIIFMRKTVVDGSNTSGFQRTGLVARKGFMDLLSGKVNVSTICVEEDSAKIVERKTDYDVYNLSRLGIPLVEIATEADIFTPEQLKEVAEYIGMVLRSTGKVKRGLGTIRQDVNVSIKEGDRVEIKGAQNLLLLPKLAENEILRQKNLVQISKFLKEKAEVKVDVVDLTDLFLKTDSKMISGALKKGCKIKSLRLKGFKGLVGREIQPGKRLGTELSDYAKAHAKVKGLMHSDELPNYGITEQETNSIKEKLNCEKEDAFIFVVDEEEKAINAIEAAADRCKQAVKGVPKEVRKANQDATTTYLRPMPGSERMYPETDSRPFCPSEKIEKIKLISETADTYQNMGLGKDLAHSIAKSGATELFDLMVEENTNVNPSFIAEVMTAYPKEMEKRNFDPSNITQAHLKLVFKALNENQIAKESVMKILTDVSEGHTPDLSRYKTMSDKQLEQKLKKIANENKGKPFNAIIGKAMSELRGKASGKKISEKLKELTE